MLVLTVLNQTLIKTRIPAVKAKQQNYLQAQFNFSEDWDGLTRTAQFWREDGVDFYPQPVDKNGLAEVPWEVTEEPGSFFMTIFATNGPENTNKVITTNAVEIIVDEDGMRTDPNDKDPTMGVFGKGAAEALKAIDDHAQLVVDQVNTAGNRQKQDIAETGNNINTQIEHNITIVNDLFTDIGNEHTNAVKDISTTKARAVEDVGVSETNAKNNILSAERAAVTNINGTAEKALEAVNRTSDDGVELILTNQKTTLDLITEKKTIAVNEINTTKGTALEEVSQSSQRAADSASNALQSATQAEESSRSSWQSAEDAKTQADLAKGSALKAEQEANRATETVNSKVDGVDFRNNILSIPLLANALAQGGEQLQKVTNRLKEYENIENGRVVLKNTLEYPFNNSQTTLPLYSRRNGNYIILTDIVSFTGGSVGEIESSARLNNGFKIAFTGSAKEATLKYTVIGGV